MIKKKRKKNRQVAGAWYFCGDDVAARPPMMKRFVALSFLGECGLNSAIAAFAIIAQWPPPRHNG